MDWEIIIEVGKWVVIVLITGFVAQFGKRFAEYILEGRKKNKESDAGELSKNGSVTVSREKRSESLSKREKELQKLEKKRLKAEAKKLKKQQ